MLHCAAGDEAVELPVANRKYSFKHSHIMCSSLQGDFSVGPPVTPDQCLSVRQQVAQQLSPLLRLGHMARLQPLIELLHEFVLYNCGPGQASLLSGAVGLVFTDAVLDAALGSSTLSKEAYLTGALTQPCSLMVNCCCNQPNLIRHAGTKTINQASGILTFDAVLLRDFHGGSAGEAVSVTLDLFGSRLAHGGLSLQRSTQPAQAVSLPVQVVMGHLFENSDVVDCMLQPVAALGTN